MRERRLSFAGAGYEPRSGTERATAISAILGLHAVAVVAFVSAGGIQVVMREAEPILVRILPAPPPKPVEIPRSVPLPNLRPPEIRLPDPPPIENLYTLRMEETAPASAPVVAAVPSPNAAPSTAIPAPVLEPPRADMAYLNNPPPAYPTVSKRAGEQGRVMLRVRVDAKGTVEEIEVQATSGFPRLDEAARDAVRRWRFMPAKLGDRAVAGVGPRAHQFHPAGIDRALMLRRFVAAATTVLGLLVPLAAHAQAGAVVVHLLDYIAVDYGEAVADGKVKNAGEYQEMTEFAANVVQGVQDLPPRPERERLVESAVVLRGLISAKAAPDQVAAAASRLRDAVVAAYRVSIGPKRAPDLARGRLLFAEHCASCHGADGRGDGPLAKGMEPPPADFHDAARQRLRSVHGLYNTLTLGVAGTAMARVPEAPEADRWALAYLASPMGRGRRDGRARRRASGKPARCARPSPTRRP